jgi:6-phosphogluconolactonase
MVGKFKVVSDVDRLAHAAADWFVSLASAAIAKRGRFAVALAGGSTPRPAYSLLAEQPRAQKVDWGQVEVFWGDERSVPPDHPDSNYRMARRALLDRVPIPGENVHRIQGELRPQEAAAAYRLELRNHLGVDGRFDLILLGMGPDGHAASLFPSTGAVDENERSVIPVYVEKFDVWRVTLTLPVINKARHVVFLVAGDAKAEALARVHAGEPLPAAMVQPADGQLIWLVDRRAAARLSRQAWGGP